MSVSEDESPNTNRLQNAMAVATIVGAVLAIPAAVWYLNDLVSDKDNSIGQPAEDAIDEVIQEHGHILEETNDDA